MSETTQAGEGLVDDLLSDHERALLEADATADDEALPAEVAAMAKAALQDDHLGFEDESEAPTGEYVSRDIKPADEPEAKLAVEGQAIVPDAPALPAPTKTETKAAAKPAAAKKEEFVEDDGDPQPAQSIRERSVVSVLFDLAKDSATGVLRLEGKPGALDLRINKGEVIEVVSNAADLSLEKYLVSEAVITAIQLEGAEAKKDSFGGDLGATLISTGLVQPHIFLEKVAAWSRSVIEQAISWTSGKTQFTKKLKLKPSAIPLGFKSFKLITESVRNGLDKKEIEKRLSDMDAVPVLSHREDGLTVDVLQMAPKELRIFRGINGVESLGHMIENKPGVKQDPLPFLRLIYLTSELGMVKFLESRKQEVYEKRTKELSALASKLEKANFFDVLGVDAKSSDEDVTRGYRNGMKEHHPDALSNDIPAELAAAHMKLYGIYQDAYQALESEEKRKQYTVVVREGYRDEESAVKGIVKSRLAVKKAKVVAKLNKHKEALKFINDALASKPDDFTLHIYRAYFEYMLAGGIDPNMAEMTLLKINKLIPEKLPVPEDDKKKKELSDRLADAYTYLGRLYKQIGEPRQSLRAFQHVLEHEARHPEAQNEVRMAQMRKDSGVGRGPSVPPPTPVTPDGEFEQLAEEAMEDGKAPGRKKSAVPRGSSAISFLKKAMKKD